METLPPGAPTQEKFKHFDALASIDLLRFDLATEGSVRAETMQRVYDEELSYVAEGIDRPATTVFTLKDQGGELVYFSKGKWEPYRTLLIKGIESAKLAAADDSRKNLLVEMAADDLLIANQWNGLRPGEKMHWYSPFRDRELKLYGEKFMNELGLQSKRRMGFLYQAERTYEGNLILTTMSVDNSDDTAFEAAMEEASSSKDIVSARQAYDQVLSEKYGRPVRAGRLTGEEEENAWEVIQKQRDLVDYYFERLENLAGNYLLSRPELEREKKRLTYGFWAAIKERMDRAQMRLAAYVPDGGPSLPLAREMAMAYARLQAKGEILFGCGGSITGEDALMQADSADVFDSIFGKSKGETGDKNTMRCVHCPKCRTFHDEVKKTGDGKYKCKNTKCGYEVKAK